MNNLNRIVLACGVIVLSAAVAFADEDEFYVEQPSVESDPAVPQVQDENYVPGYEPLHLHQASCKGIEDAEARKRCKERPNKRSGKQKKKDLVSSTEISKTQNTDVAYNRDMVRGCVLGSDGVRVEGPQDFAQIERCFLPQLLNRKSQRFIAAYCNGQFPQGCSPEVIEYIVRLGHIPDEIAAERFPELQAPVQERER